MANALRLKKSISSTLSQYSYLDFIKDVPSPLPVSTNSQLNTDTQGTVVDRDYGIWFPSVFISRKINDTLSLNLSYSKRITRPTFNDLAPFVIFFDPNTFLSGNASLQPAISNTFKFDVNYKSYFLSFQYTNEDSSIANFQERIDTATGRLIFEAANLVYIKTFGITFFEPRTSVENPPSTARRANAGAGNIAGRFSVLARAAVNS